MNACETFQTRILDHLYGLLDEADAQALAAHLEGCDACRAARARAEQQQQVITFAARAQFPGVRFEAPALKAEPAAPPTIAFTPPARSRRWGRWATAAAVLIAAGLGLAGGLTLYRSAQDSARARDDYARATHARTVQLQEQEQQRQREHQDIAEIQEQIRLLEAKWGGEMQKVSQEIAGRDVQITVTGPKSIQPGAPNVYQIDARPRLERAPPGKLNLTARIVDATSKRVLFSRSLAAGTTRWELPRDLPVKPGTQLALVVTEDADAPLTAARVIGAAVAPGGPAPLAALLHYAARDGGRVRLSEALQLIGTVHVSHLATDRPMYRPGEVVHFRSLTLERFSLKPAREDFQLRYRITDPRGAEVFALDGPARVKRADGKEIVGPDGKAVRGVGAGEFRIPPAAAGGEYTLTLSEAQNRFPPERRKFLVNQYQAPRLNKEIEFTRKSYGPGALVEVNAKVARVEGGGVIDEQPVVVSAQVDGKPCSILDEGALRVRKGKVTIRFRLPEKIDIGQGSLSVQFQDGGTHETIVRPIPVVLKKLFVEFFPEGGDLVAGVPNRVYFTARTTLGKPAELQGRLVGPDGKEITAVRTLNDDHEAGVNQGMGRFEFTPQAGQMYEVKIDAPLGIEGHYRLPQVKADGVVLSVPEGVFSDDLRVVVANMKQPRKLLVGAYCRGRLIDHRTVAFRANESMSFLLKPAANVGGVFRVTAFEERPGQQLVPVAERLVYRRPVERLEVKVKTDKDHYAPGEKVRLTLQGKDEKGRAAPAVVMVSAVDLGLLKLADEKTARAMPAHFFLTTEVRQPEDLEYADFLVGTHPKATAALDLLLGTQGWRRFAEQQDPGQFRQRQKQDAERLLMASGNAAPVQNDLAELRVLALAKSFKAKHVAMQKKLANRERQDDEGQKLAAAAAQTLQLRVARMSVEADAAAERLRERQQEWTRYGLIAAAVLLSILSALGFVVGLSRMAQGRPGGVPYFATGLCSLMLLFLGGMGVAASLLMSRPQARQVEMAAAREKAQEQRRAGAAPRPDMAFGDQMEKLADDKGRGPRPEEEGAILKEKRGVLVLNRPAQGVEPAMMPPGPVAPLAEMPAVPAPLVPAQAMPGGVGGFQQPGMGLPAMQAEVAPMQGMGMMGGGVPMGGMGMQGGMMGMQGGGMGIPGGGQMPAFGMQGAPMPPGKNMAALGGKGGKGQQFGGEIAQFERQLRRDGKFGELAQFRMGLGFRGAKDAPVALPPLVVREYAHRHVTAADNVRRDFAETVYWHPVLVLPGDKATEIAFDLSDSVTRFQVVVWGHTLDGRLGATTAEIASRLPFSVSPKVPVEVTRSDKVTLPVTVANDSGKSLSVQLGVETKGLKLLGPAHKQFAVDAGKRVRQLFSFRPSILEGTATVNFMGRSEPLGVDRVEEAFKVVPEGFPIVGSKSDVLEGVAVHEVTLPKTWVKGTLKLQAQVYPSTLADLQKGLEAMLREPGGCFEQSSSSNYPNVMILNYLKESDQANPELEKRARQLLQNGYGRLTSFECIDPQKAQTRRGYEWFGQTAPPHEALTAYGLLQFRDMAKVHPVDAAMMERTQKYLLSRRDGKGGFKRNALALDTFGRAPQNLTNAYIVWALTEGGTADNLDPEMNALLAEAKTSKDPYFVALVSLAHLNRGKTADALELLKALRKTQQADGRLTGARTSITGSGGRDLEIETTALALLGWLRANRPAEFGDSVRGAARWVGQQRGGYGGFGSTQSTILALKALIAYTHANKAVPADADLILTVNGKEVGRKHFSAGSREELAVSVDESAGLKPGKNTIRVEMAKNTLPHTLTWSYRTLKPANPSDCPVHLTTKLDRTDAAEGETLRLTATVENKSGKGQGMAVAILGLPGGMIVPEDMKQLKELARLREDGKKPGLIAAFEIRGRELVLYWRDLAPDQKIEVNLDLICRIPGEYRGPASRAYLYYNADHKFWAQPLAVTITPRSE